MSKPTVVLIPGAWHVAEHYSLLTPCLNDAGYETLPLTLPSSGSDPAIPDFTPDVEEVRRNVIPLLDAEKNVIVVMHSYGGIPGSSAMKGLSKTDREAVGKPGGVTALVYLCAWMLDEGVSMFQGGGGRGGKAGPSSFKIEVHCVLTTALTQC
jgi:pimeloyl-ACP methyl ester carboxylesterase